MRAVTPDPRLLRWLHSKRGENWSRENFRPVEHRNGGDFAQVKLDHECEWSSRYPETGCSSGWQRIPWTDVSIRSDLEKYGISGVPDRWREWPGDPEGSNTT